MSFLNTVLNGFRAAASAAADGRTPARRRRSPMLEVSAGEAGENGRTVDAVLKSSADGLVPGIYADEIAARGPAGWACFRNFDRALRRRDPGRADRIRRQVLDRLAGDDVRAMTMERRDGDAGGRENGAGPIAPPVPPSVGGGGAGHSSSDPVGPGGAGRRQGMPSRPGTDFEQFRRESIGIGRSSGAADSRPSRHRELLAAGPESEGGRVGRLLRAGITEDSAREMARTLSPQAIEQFVRDWGGMEPGERSRLIRALTAVSAALGGGQRDAARINERTRQTGGVGGRRK